MKLQLGSVDWLSAFAERETFCSYMSFLPASKKLPSTPSVSPGVPPTRRKYEPIQLIYRAGNCPALGGEKEGVFAGGVKFPRKSELYFIIMFL